MSFVRFGGASASRESGAPEPAGVRHPPPAPIAIDRPEEKYYDEKTGIYYHDFHTFTLKTKLPISFVTGLKQRGMWKVARSDGTVNSDWEYEYGVSSEGDDAYHGWALAEKEPVLLINGFKQVDKEATPDDLLVLLMRRVPADGAPDTYVTKGVRLREFIQLNPTAKLGEFSVKAGNFERIRRMWNSLLEEFNSQLLQ